MTIQHRDRPDEIGLTGWIPDDETPTRTESVERLEHLLDNAAPADAFYFKAPVDAEGKPLRMDRQKIQGRAEIVRSHMRHGQEALRALPG